jgi:simple sugar transport system ATP-binding protein
MRRITKRFGAVIANDAIDFSASGGQIHALLGENGSGKSTLMKILYGLYQPSEGEIRLRGEKTAFRSSKQALEAGIGMIHQHFMLVPQMTVLENIVAGHNKNRFLIDYKKAAEEAEALAKRMEFTLDLYAPVHSLSVGEQQRAEILKTLYRGADIIILDEPTAVLTPRETGELQGILRFLAAGGRTVIFISHKLEEALEFAGLCTVLRGGRKIKTLRTADTDKKELARMMVGRDVVFRIDKPPCRAGKTVVSVKDLCLYEKGRALLDHVAFSIARGEILGLAGVDGNGQSELSEVLAGMRRPDSGEIRIKGKTMAFRTAAAALAQGVAMIPAERNGVGAIGQFSVQENCILRDSGKPPFSRYGLLRQKAIRRHAEKLAGEYDIRLSSVDEESRLLSGGNLQKLILARELSRMPEVLICFCPTRGLDVGGIEDIQKRLLQTRERGAAILLISTELEEILTLSDRIAVLHRGKIMGILPGNGKTSIETIGLLMAGGAPTGEAGGPGGNPGGSP